MKKKIKITEKQFNMIVESIIKNNYINEEQLEEGALSKVAGALAILATTLFPGKTEAAAIAQMQQEYPELVQKVQTDTSKSDSKGYSVSTQTNDWITPKTISADILSQGNTVRYTGKLPNVTFKNIQGRKDNMFEFNVSSPKSITFETKTDNFETVEKTLSTSGLASPSDFDINVDVSDDGTVLISFPKLDGLMKNLEASMDKKFHTSLMNNRKEALVEYLNTISIEIGVPSNSVIQIP